MSSPSTGSTATRKIVLAKIEALADGHQGGVESTEQQVEDHVVGYLEVQQEGAEGGTIYLQPDEIEIDGEHLLLAQGEEGGEIIFVVSTDEETGLSTISKCDGTTEIVYAQDDQTLVEVPVLSEKNEFQSEAETLEITQKDAVGIEESESNLISTVCSEENGSVLEVVNNVETFSENQVLEKSEGENYFQVVTESGGHCTVDGVRVDENGIVCHVVEDIEKERNLNVVKSQVDYVPANNVEREVQKSMEENVITVQAQIGAEPEVVDLSEETPVLYENIVTTNPNDNIVTDVARDEHHDCSKIAEVETVVQENNSETEPAYLPDSVTRILPTCDDFAESKAKSNGVNVSTNGIVENDNVRADVIGNDKENENTNTIFTVEVKDVSSESKTVSHMESSAIELCSNSTVFVENTDEPNKETGAILDIERNAVINQVDKINSENKITEEIALNTTVSEDIAGVQSTLENACDSGDVENLSPNIDQEDNNLNISPEDKSAQVTIPSETMDSSLRNSDPKLSSDSQQSGNMSENMVNEACVEIESKDLDDDTKDKEYNFREESFDTTEHFRRGKLTYQSRRSNVESTAENVACAVSEGSEAKSTADGLVNGSSNRETSVTDEKTQENQSEKRDSENTVISKDLKNAHRNHEDSTADVKCASSPEKESNCFENAKDSLLGEESAVDGDKLVPSSTELANKSVGTPEENVYSAAMSSNSTEVSDSSRTEEAGLSSEDVDKTSAEKKGNERRKSARQQALRESKIQNQCEDGTDDIQTPTKKVESLDSDESKSGISESNINSKPKVSKMSTKQIKGSNVVKNRSSDDFDALFASTNKDHSPNGVSESSFTQTSGGKKRKEGNSKRSSSEFQDSPSKRTRHTPNKKVTFGKPETKSQEERFDDLLQNRTETTTSTPTKKSYTPLMSSLGFNITSSNKKRKGSSSEETLSKKPKVGDRTRKKDTKATSPKSTPVTKGVQDVQNQFMDLRSERETESCTFYIRYQSPTKTPEKDKTPPSLFNCKECHFKTARLENIIHHYKECSLVLQQDIFQWDVQGQGMGEKVPTRFTLEKESAIVTTPVKSTPKKPSAKNETSKKMFAKKPKLPKVSQKDAVHAGEGDAAVSDTKESADAGLDSFSDAFESDTDSDDLPPAFGTPSKSDLLFKENDIVWVDWKNQHWPALVRKIYPKTKKVSILFIDTPMPEKGMRVSMRKITTFDNAARNKQYVSESRTKASGDQQIKAVQKAEDYLRKLCLGLKMSAFDFFNRPEGCLSDLETSGEMDTSGSLLDHPLLGAHESHLTVSQIADTGCDDDEEVNQEEDMPLPGSAAMEEKLQKMKVFRKEQNVKFLNCIKEGKVETHLLELYQGTAVNERHRKFHSAVASERNQLKHVNWFGPIDDEEQQEEIIDYCLNLFKTHFVKKESFDLMAYVFEVWTPEAIIKAISQALQIELSEAGNIFEQGTSWNYKYREPPEQTNAEPELPLPP